MGDTRTRHSNFRLICATNKNLQEQIRKGNFRLDLFFRLNIFPVVVPLLTDRLEDIEGLIDRILTGPGLSCAGVSDQALLLLKGYPSQGMSELRNVLERAAVLARRKTLLPEHFPGLTATEDNPSIFNLNDLAEARISRVLQKCEGDTKRASRELGISRATLYRKLRRFQEKRGCAAGN